MLSASALFRGFSLPDVVKSLAQLDARRKAYGDGEVVVNEHDPSTRMGVLLSGFLHVYDSAFKGRRHLLRIVRPGQVLGASLVGTRQPDASYPALVTAFGDCVTAILPLANVSKFAKTGGGRRLSDNLTTVVREELQAAWRKISVLSCPNIAERVMLSLRSFARFEKEKTFAIGSTEAEFADYLGVSDAALSRTLRKLAKEGRFTYKRDVFTLP